MLPTLPSNRLLDPRDFKHLFDAVGVATMVIEMRGESDLHYVFLNREAEAYFGISNDEYAGKKIEAYRGKDEQRRERRQRTMTAYIQCVESGSAVTLELEHVHPQLGVRWGRHVIVPLRNGPDGAPVRQVMVTSLDVTRLLATQKKLDDALTRTLSEFVTICAECKDIKSDDSWVSIEVYASEKLDYRSFSHGVCPKCLKHHLEDSE